MAVWKLKSCPRCSGDVFVAREVDGWRETCLLCGYHRDVSDVVVMADARRVIVKAQPALFIRTWSHRPASDSRGGGANGPTTQKAAIQVPMVGHVGPVI
jgi:ribosomal protein S27AE